MADSFQSASRTRLCLALRMNTNRHEKIHDMGAPRITTTIKAGTRTDRKQTMADKIASVEAKQ